jgi:hypothetical protein
MSWTWTRAVWTEHDDAVMEGTVPSAWISKNILRWPKKNYQKCIMRREVPTDESKHFKIMKTKLVNSMFSLYIYGNAKKYPHV